MEDAHEKDPEVYSEQIKMETEKALLRMSENRVRAELKVDELEAKLSAKNDECQSIKE